MRTPEEIFKASLICTDQSGLDCKDCGYYSERGCGCDDHLREDAFSLVCEMAASADKPSEDDPVNHPSHYTQGGIECIDAIKAATTGLVGFEGYCTGNIIKYLWRWKHKNGLEDLRKAGWYLGALIGSKEE